MLGFARLESVLQRQFYAQMVRTAEHPVELSHKEILESRIQEAIRLARGPPEKQMSASSNDSDSMKLRHDKK
ncbi:MAG: hypothetical protein STSR0001_12280 [Methanothrix sp.]